MSELQVGRLTTILRRLLVLGRGGEGKVAPEIEDAVVPVIIIEGERAEHYHLGGTALRCWRTSALPVGAQDARARIRNPAGSGSLIVIEAVSFFDEIGGVWQKIEIRREFPFTDTDLAGGAAAASGVRDFRRDRNDNGAAILSFSVGSPPPATASTLFDQFTYFGESRLHPISWILPPGSSLDMVALLAGSPTIRRFQFYGYERPIERSEVQ